MSDRAGLDVRRDDCHVAEVSEGGRKRMDAVRMDAVVVGDQDLCHCGAVGGKPTNYSNEWLQ